MAFLGRSDFAGVALVVAIVATAAVRSDDAHADAPASPAGSSAESKHTVAQKADKKPRPTSAASERKSSSASSDRDRNKKTDSASNDGDAAKGKSSQFAAREKIALNFAREHHRQLADLLLRMKRDENRRAYEEAISDVYADSARLKRFQERDSQKYALALEIWKLDSRVRLLAARMAMSPTPEQEQELKTTLRERVDLQIELLQLDRDRSAARAERLQNAIDALQQDPEAAAQKSLDRLKRSINAPRTRRNKTQGQTPSAAAAVKTLDSSAIRKR